MNVSRMSVALISALFAAPQLLLTSWMNGAPKRDRYGRVARDLHKHVPPRYERWPSCAFDFQALDDARRKRASQEWHRLYCRRRGGYRRAV